MARHVSLGELAVSTAGLALRRAMFTGTDQDARAATELIGRAMAGLSSPPLNHGYELVEAGASTGYGVIAMPTTERAARTSTLSSRRCGVCSTGCQSGRPWMSRVGRADTWRASPGSVTTSSASISLRRCSKWRGSGCPTRRSAWGPWERCRFGRISDLTVCSLSLEHEPDPEPALADLARITRIGGRVLISDVHPFAILLDHQAQFESAPGERVLIRAYPHFHGRLLELFSRNGLVVEQCLEPTIGPGPGLSGRACQGLVGDHVTAAAWSGLPIVVVWQLRREGAP